LIVVLLSFLIVDKFVIVESTYNHRGQKKKLNFNINNFLKFKDKIEYASLLTVERAQENYSENYMYDMEGSGFFETTSKIASHDLILVLKIVSDNSKITDISSSENISLWADFGDQPKKAI